MQAAVSGAEVLQQRLSNFSNRRRRGLHFDEFRVRRLGENRSYLLSPIQLECRQFTNAKKVAISRKIEAGPASAETWSRPKSYSLAFDSSYNCEASHRAFFNTNRPMKSN